ncbi:histone-lysine N-methyltransferase Clr4 [Aspergillus affinis]|uniref:histone-lysine N-methyltransferase Clr4 n=1 Tax=Aspergillus affinis TaxID=1070780 RepID=UPI0022FE9FCB|nr:histone H3 methyltransferase SUV39H1/Clr4 [Aspergillus affinis]KAI9036419.1 histone H3 methyltransferase SUV39H1/Clr4 [Aspergillus affinis]
MVIDLTQDSDSDNQNRLQTWPVNGNHVLPAQPAFTSSLTNHSTVPLKRKQDGLEWPSAVPDGPFNQANFSGFPNGDSKGADSENPASQSTDIYRIQAQRKLQSFAEHNYQSSYKKRPHIIATNGTYQSPYEPNYKPHLSQSQAQPSTPSPGPTSQEEGNKIAVVVPSPSRQLKREIASASWSRSDHGPTGLSQEYYPTDAYEKRALKGIYPSTRKVNRAKIPFQIGSPGPFLTSPPKINRQLQLSLERKLSGIKGPPVTFAAADQKLLAQFGNFEFINSNKLRRGVQPAPEEFHGGCSCDSFCDPGRCTCLETEENDSKSTIIPYERAKDDGRLMVLTPDFLKRRMMISECGSRCDCNAACWNRVVQSGRQVRLEIFHTGNRGFGLRSPDLIRAGQFIDCYLGEVVTKDVADVREELCMAKHGHSYLFGLDWFVDTVAEEDMFVIDGQKFGAPTRFMNHSCNPNCRLLPATRNNADQRLYDLAFFSLKEIPPMTELTFDYNPDAESVDVVSEDSQAKLCLCGEPNCRKQLWPNQRKGTR